MGLKFRRELVSSNLDNEEVSVIDKEEYNLSKEVCLELSEDDLPLCIK